MKIRLIKRVGTQIKLTPHWGEGCQGYNGEHEAETIFNFPEMADFKEASLKLDELYRNPENWPTHCKFCGAPLPDDERHSGGTAAIYDTGKTKPEPGDMFFNNYHEPNESCPAGWTNCDGNHLFVILPNGNTWDIDSRASNCTMPNEKTHRCWVRHGEPPNVHVDKNGVTCAAGAGSIMSGNYHGFLHNGELVQC